MALLTPQTLINNFRSVLASKTWVLAIVVTAITASGSVAYAISYDAQINKLRQQNASNSAQKSNLQTQAGSISEQIGAIQGEISAVESQIQDNRSKDAQLKTDIATAEVELTKQKAVLAENIKQIYIENGMSTLEMIASSKTLSEYVDRAQYRNTVQGRVNTLVAQVEATKKQLSEQQAQVSQLLTDQQNMQANLADKRAENGRLLGLNQQQQADITKNVQANNSKITELQRLQAIENARYNIGKVTVGGTGGYPWYNVKYPSYSADPWGMYKRECVSYTAWKVATSGRKMPYWGGHGNAKLWDDNARAAGIPVDTSPRVGDIAVSNSGTYGHVMYVEAVSSGSITVSQYNASWDGKYSVAKRATTGLVFIHFR